MITMSEKRHNDFMNTIQLNMHRIWIWKWSFLFANNIFISLGFTFFFKIFNLFLCEWYFIILETSGKQTPLRKARTVSIIAALCLLQIYIYYYIFSWSQCKENPTNTFFLPNETWVFSFISCGYYFNLKKLMMLLNNSYITPRVYFCRITF